jgi:hypothetical protein
MMLNYGSFCYLQNQKTGGTFVESFLRQFCTLPLLDYNKHASVAVRLPDVFYFSNVREPLALYRSLYAYGLEGKGTVFVRMKELGLSDFYAQGPAGFEPWLSFVLKPDNAPVLANGYTPEVARWIGFMSWRFMRLACHGFERAAAGITSTEEAKTYIDKNYLLGRVLRQENLRAELAQLAQGPLLSSLRNPPAALRWLAEVAPVNVSQAAAAVQAMPLSETLHTRVVRREQILYKNFYTTQQSRAQHVA